MKSTKDIELKSIELGSSNLGIFFRQYVELMNPLLSLSNRQMDVLGVLLHQNHKLSKIFNNPEDPIKWHTLFSSNSRKEMAGMASMDSANLNNILKVLRDKNLVTFNNIKKELLITPGKDGFVLQFKFKFNIVENEGSSKVKVQ